MQVETSFVGNVFEARLSGRLAFADNARFRKLIEEARDARPEICRLDASNLDMIDSSGLGMLMIAVEESRKSGFELSLVNAHGPVLKLLQLSRLDQVLKAA